MMHSPLQHAHKTIANAKQSFNRNYIGRAIATLAMLLIGFTCEVAR